MAECLSTPTVYIYFFWKAMLMTFMSVSAASLMCAWPHNSNLQLRACVFVWLCCVIAGEGWHGDINSLNTGTLLRSQGMKKQTSQLNRGELTRTSVGFHVVGRWGCGWKSVFVGCGLEWFGWWGCVGRRKDCQRNVFLEISCVVEMTVFFLTWTAAITP